MNYSLRQLLLVTLLSTVMLVLGIAAYRGYKEIRNEVGALFDAELAQSARALNSFVAHLLIAGSLYELWDLDKTEKFESTKIFNHRYEKKLAFQLIYKDEGLILRSESAPPLPLSTTTNGFSKTKINDHLWHVFSISQPKNEYIIHVGQRDEIRQELMDEISKHLIKPFLIGLPFLGLAIWIIVGRALKPVNQLTGQLAKREANYLEPLPTKKLPSEIVPVVNELNNLFRQLEQAFEHERRFTADASHELRTPLAGLLTQAQVALRTNDETVRKQALRRIEQAVNRMTNMVQQLLTFSRIDSNSEYLTKEMNMLDREIVPIVAELEPEAHKKRIRMEFEEENVAPIFGNSLLISILIRNLIDNAIKYTPINGVIRIALSGMVKHLELCVEDSGPGIAPEQYEASLKRFHRCLETANVAQGSGLGFSMVQRIAIIHNAKLTLSESQFGGLKVSVLFPLPKKPVENNRYKKLRFFHINKST
jgi:two-component system, OmpR family, sensor histidine kinase QseC